jgi:O-acetyl-ADP-ribose deacetylase (regulator of RNase III)
MEIQYLTGDATRPQTEGPAIIVHVCNDIGGWGAGFVLALSKRWPEPERRYRAWHRGAEDLPFRLGEVQFVKVEPQTWIANLIGQRGIHASGGKPPVRYEAIRSGLSRIAQAARELGASVHMPRIGCGLAGGHWEEVGCLVEEELSARGIEVTVYDLPPRSG